MSRMSRKSAASDENGYTVIKAIFVPDEADLKEEIFPISGDIERMMTAEGVRYYHTFTANGTYTFEYMDSAGNRGSVTAAVNALSTESASINSIAWYGTKPPCSCIFSYSLRLDAG